MEIKRTPLFETHVSLNAKMAPFAGYEMPIRYTSDLEEHHVVRQAAGIFDVSHMGEFYLSGEHALELIQKVTTNDASKLAIGQAQYSCLPNGRGGIVDDLLVYRMEDQSYMLVVNASNIEKDWAWIVSQNEWELKMENQSDQWGLLAVQGPKAIDILQKLTDIELSEIPYYHFKIANMAGIKDLIISNTGYTGSGGFELYIPAQHTVKVWHEIMNAGQSLGIKPCGLGARDTLRLEMGFCLYGNDIDDNTSPLEAGLGWITKWSKQFIDDERLKSQKERGVSEKLVGFKMVEKGIPRHGYSITDGNGNRIGTVTSGTQSPTLQIGIGLGYVHTAFAGISSEIYIDIRGKQIKAQVSKLPFYIKG